ncbi:hypothetical protein RhiirA1_483544, partial [Rhizophagus irregularis]
HQNFVVATKPFHTLRHIAYEHFIKIDKSPLNNSLQRPLDAILTPYPSLPSNNIDNHIDQALICHPDLKMVLSNISVRLIVLVDTDGPKFNPSRRESISVDPQSSSHRLPKVKAWVYSRPSWYLPSIVESIFIQIQPTVSPFSTHICNQASLVRDKN